MDDIEWMRSALWREASQEAVAAKATKPTPAPNKPAATPAPLPPPQTDREQAEDALRERMTALAKVEAKRLRSQNRGIEGGYTKAEPTKVLRDFTSRRADLWAQCECCGTFRDRQSLSRYGSGSENMLICSDRPNCHERAVNWSRRDAILSANTPLGRW